MKSTKMILLAVIAGLMTSGCGIIINAAQGEYSKKARVERKADRVAKQKKNELVKGFVYDMPCSELRPDVENMMVKFGETIYTSEPGKPMTTVWDYVKAEYSNGDKIRSGYQKRYMVEFDQPSEGSCTAAIYQQKKYDSGTNTDRRLVTESSLIRTHDPEAMKEIEREAEKARQAYIDENLEDKQKDDAKEDKPKENGESEGTASDDSSNTDGPTKS